MQGERGRYLCVKPEWPGVTALVAREAGHALLGLHREALNQDLRTCEMVFTPIQLRLSSDSVLVAAASAKLSPACSYHWLS